MNSNSSATRNESGGLRGELAGSEVGLECVGDGPEWGRGREEVAQMRSGSVTGAAHPQAVARGALIAEQWHE